MFEFLVAVALLTAPVDSPDPRVESYSVVPSLRTVAVQLEILDPREVGYVLSRPEDFTFDLKLLRRRYHELRHAPPLADGVRFPDRAAVNDMLTFNRAYRQNLENRLAVDLVRAEELQAAVRESDKLYQVWDLVRDARCDYYYVTVRRQALSRLREMIGREAYYGSVLPPYVPLWRFQTID